MRIFICTVLALLLTLPASAQDATPTAPVIPTVNPIDTAALEEIRALVEEARTHAEDAGRYAGDASNFLGIFEALGLAVTVGGGLLAAFGVLRLLSAESELTKTRERFEKELKTKEDELNALTERLLSQAGQMQRESAESSSRATLALSLLPLGERQYRAQDFEGAIQTYRRALELDEMNPVTHLRLGYVYTQSGKLEDARIHLTRALEIEPDFPNALASLGYVYRRIGEKMSQGIERDEMLNRSEGKLLEALRLSPMLIDDDGESWWGSLGGLYRRRNQVEQAITAYERAATVTPHSSYPVSNLALLYLQISNRERMLSTFKRVERLARGETQAEVDNYWGYADLLTSQLALGKTTDAENSLQSVLELAPPSSPYVLDMLADTLERLSRALEDMPISRTIDQFAKRIRAENAARQSQPTS